MSKPTTTAQGWAGNGAGHHSHPQALQHPGQRHTMQKVMSNNVSQYIQQQVAPNAFGRAWWGRFLSGKGEGRQQGMGRQAAHPCSTSTQQQKVSACTTAAWQAHGTNTMPTQKKKLQCLSGVHLYTHPPRCLGWQVWCSKVAAVEQAWSPSSAGSRMKEYLLNGIEWHIITHQTTMSVVPSSIPGIFSIVPSSAAQFPNGRRMVGGGKEMVKKHQTARILMPIRCRWYGGDRQPSPLPDHLVPPSPISNGNKMVVGEEMNLVVVVVVAASAKSLFTFSQ